MDTNIRKAALMTFAAALLGLGAASPVEAALPKRGLCANRLSVEDRKALSPGVGWWYSWFHQTEENVRQGGMEFIPMIWDEAPDRLTGAGEYLRRGPKPPMLFANNEPNLTGQANLAPKDAAESWKKTSALAKARGLPLIGPHMAIGAPANEVVHGYDPIQKKQRNLSYMIDWLDAFFHYVDPSTVDGIGLHAYGNVHELKWAVAEVYKKYKKPVWVTEFAWWDAKDAAAEAAYLIEAVDFLERSPEVAGYAWFKERMGKGHKLSLLEQDRPGELTKLGKIYVHMPTHDPAVFHPVPGRIEAEADVRMSGVKISLTNDPGGKFEVGDIEAGDWMEYQIEVAAAGTYTLAVRAMAGRGLGLKVGLAGKELVTLEEPAPSGGAAWTTCTTTLRLPTGKHSLRVEATGSGAVLNWFELSQKPGARG